MKIKISGVFLAILVLSGLSLQAKKNSDSAEKLVTDLYDMLTIKKTTLPDWNQVKNCFNPEAIIVL